MLDHWARGLWPGPGGSDGFCPLPGTTIHPVATCQNTHGFPLLQRTDGTGQTKNPVGSQLACFWDSVISLSMLF